MGGKVIIFVNFSIASDQQTQSIFSPKIREGK